MAGLAAIRQPVCELMAELNTRPGSSTAKQHQTLVVAARRRGLELPEIRRTVGGSIRKLSSAEASDWIKRFSGSDLPNPPGRKPSAYAAKKTTGAVRMITVDQVDQIERLMLEYFDYDRPLTQAWLRKNFKVDTVRDLATAQRGGQVIVVLKKMHARREECGQPVEQGGSM